MPIESLAVIPKDDESLEGLTPRQQAFIREYIVDLNATQAAIRAGYSYNSAEVEGHRQLSKDKVREAVERLKAQRASRVQVTADSVLHEMSLLANSDLEHYYVDDEGQVRLVPGAPEGAMRAIQSMKRRTRVYYDKEGFITHKQYEVEIRLWDKPQPLKLMGKHIGLFPDRMEHTGKDGGPIETVSKVERVILDTKIDESDSTD